MLRASQACLYPGAGFIPSGLPVAEWALEQPLESGVRRET